MIKNEYPYLLGPQSSKPDKNIQCCGPGIVAPGPAVVSQSSSAPVGTPGQTPIKSPHQKKLKVMEVAETPEVAPEEHDVCLDSQTTMEWDASPSTPRDLSAEFEKAIDAVPTPRVPTVEVTSPTYFSKFYSNRKLFCIVGFVAKLITICPRIK